MDNYKNLLDIYWIRFLIFFFFNKFILTYLSKVFNNQYISEYI